MLHKTLIACVAVVALSGVPAATNALAAGHPGGHASVEHGATGHAMAGPAHRGHAAGFARGSRVARYGRGYRNGPIYNGPIYDSCEGYGNGYGDGYGYGYGPNYGGCASYGVPVVGGVINGVFGGYAPY